MEHHGHVRSLSIITGPQRCAVPVWEGRWERHVFTSSTMVALLAGVNAILAITAAETTVVVLSLLALMTIIIAALTGDYRQWRVGVSVSLISWAALAVTFVDSVVASAGIWLGLAWTLGMVTNAIHRPSPSSHSRIQ